MNHACGAVCPYVKQHRSLCFLSLCAYFAPSQTCVAGPIDSLGYPSLHLFFSIAHTPDLFLVKRTPHSSGLGWPGDLRQTRPLPNPRGLDWCHSIPLANKWFRHGCVKQLWPMRHDRKSTSGFPASVQQKFLLADNNRPMEENESSS